MVVESGCGKTGWLKKNEIGLRFGARQGLKQTGQPTAMLERLQAKIYKAQETERNKFAAKLSEEDMKGNLFRIAKQLVRNNKDVVGSGSVKDREGNIAVDDSRIKQVWKEYFQKLLNEEFEWNKDLLEDASPTGVPAERITEEEVRAAIAKQKLAKQKDQRAWC